MEGRDQSLLIAVLSAPNSGFSNQKISVEERGMGLAMFQSMVGEEREGEREREREQERAQGRWWEGESIYLVG